MPKTQAELIDRSSLIATHITDWLVDKKMEHSFKDLKHLLDQLLIRTDRELALLPRHFYNSAWSKENAPQV